MKKFEPKVMLLIAISPKGISRPVLTSGRGMAVNSSTYITKCLNPCLVPFLREKYPNGGYVFWPDKASSHYAATTRTFIDIKGVSYVLHWSDEVEDVASVRGTATTEKA